MPGIVKPPQTLYDKVFRDHIVDEKNDGTILLYIGEQHPGGSVATFLTIALDRHLVHEVTSPVCAGLPMSHYTKLRTHRHQASIRRPKECRP
jgi:homoaconitase/3-isopropylmalate dehydratase large subunit